VSYCVFWLVHWPCLCSDCQELRLQYIFLGKACRKLVSFDVIFTWLIILCFDALWESDRRIQQTKPTVTSRSSYLRGREIPGHLDVMLTAHGAGTGKRLLERLNLSVSLALLSLKTATTLMMWFVTPCSFGFGGSCFLHVIGRRVPFWKMVATHSLNCYLRN
jgi:hypothetical protein